MTNLLGMKLIDGKYVWLVAARETRAGTPLKYMEYRIEWEKGPEKVYPNAEKAWAAFNKLEKTR